MKLRAGKILLFSFFLFPLILTSCSKRVIASTEANRVVVWTSCPEFAQYAELFNKTHSDNHIVVVYKANPAESLPPAKDELPPDIISGPFLRTDDNQKYFKPLDYFFDRRLLTSSIFYPQMLESGKFKKHLYLFPVSFNLPVIIFSEENSSFVTNSYTLSIEEIRNIAASYNQKNKKGSYIKIGFTPLNSPDFLYLVTKMNGVDFRDERGNVAWNQGRLDSTVTYMRNWFEKENLTASIEQDFAFKYLFMPDYRKVTSNRTLFAYTTSDIVFKTMKDLELNIDYRWIADEKSIYLEDSYMMMGIYKKARNQPGATAFISWFFDSENQEAVLARKAELNLNTEIFGIAGGFSAVKDVTEHILPIYYTQLLSNLPPEDMMKVPQKLPARWDSYKSIVVQTYLTSAISAEEGAVIESVSDLEKEWRRKVFDN
ncbi:MAG: extracellular solute-binding protein [Treponema sp.]|nr:extracellular solute-binding protein [Treponema sp.]